MDWSLNWNAVGAIAQATAAGATFLAVGVALWIGIRDGRRSLQARYDDTRPALVIISDSTVIPVQHGNGSELDWNQHQVKIDVQNIGNGPAFNLRSVIYGPEATAVRDALNASWKYRSNDKENHWYDWTTDAVSPGEKKLLEYVLASPQSPIKFAEANKHIKSRKHKQKYPFNAPAQPLAQPTQTEPWCICRVTMTYQDIFHRKHACIYDLIFRQGWQVVAVIDDITKDLSDLVE